MVVVLVLVSGLTFS
jgi:hypothetical protein